ncbi:hypothetical protein BS50DRAFT_578201 [Corynespora cassiicola Philippines]|uniref:DUF7580 domain-containing protein n=1 Tax=Corynespora cassiicola Philippines TaxID=1448308 RepID=A0A2T2N8A4_CORCC|nr:hypothetical protein BS50DRAFT_578201 [Corynespora cassiicola Philippines]
MAEIAGLVIGIVPIVVEILKSYGVAKERLKTFAHHVQVAYDVQLRYRVAATNFRHECHKLLKAVVEDAREHSQMIEDPAHSGWRDPFTEERLRDFLGIDYQLMEDVVVKIRDLLRETHKQFADLDRGLSKEKSDSRTAALRRLYKAFDLSFKENSYRKLLEDLDQWNTKLGRLSDQRYKIQKPRTPHLDCLVRKSTPKRFTDIRIASQKLHDSLRDSWSCTNISHEGHQAKLSLDASSEYGTARLDMVIACHRKPSTGTASVSKSLITPLESPMWLQIRSISTNEPVQQSVCKSPALLGHISSSIYTPNVPLASQLTPSHPRPVVAKPKKTLKRVRFDRSDPGSPPHIPPNKITSPRATKQQSAVTFTMLNLKTTPSVCCHLRSAFQSAPCKDVSLGYLESLESPQSFRFIFYDASCNRDASIAKNMPGTNAHSISLELAHLRVLHQLTLAHKLATAVLQYHSTSWLSQDWDLDNISCFESAKITAGSPHTSEEDITKALKTLHLSTKFPPETSVTQASGDPEQMRYMYGIRNLSLANLGVALLEIGTRQKLTTSDPDSSVQAHHIISARKKLLNEPNALSLLGNRYAKIVRRCIDCDFSCGEDLTDEALQSAIYSDVVCALDDMITDWKKFTGIL